MTMPSSISIRTAAVLAFGLALAAPAVAAQEAAVIPPPAFDESGAAAGSAVAVLAGGCFWGVQGVFQHVEGVLQAVSGYAGGDRSTANYDAVIGGDTGHAETVRIVYDPSRITYGRILQIYFSVVHDPTQLNRQGPDVGPQYRSTIFPVSPEQREVAARYIAQLDAARAFPAPIVTTLEAGREFFPAEAYHQDFMFRNPSNPYIVIHDLPKVRDLERLFPNVYRDEPVLVSGLRGR